MNINKLHKEVEERENRKYKIFDKVLDICYQKILNTNQTNNNYYCSFIVPNMVFGLPLYNVNECCSYIIDKIIEKGFDVYLAHPTTLHISWKPKTQNTTTSQSTPSTPSINYYQQSHPKYALTSSQNMNTDKYINTRTTKQKKEYRHINDYKTNNNNTIYNDEDLELLHNKLDNLF
jgi:hypothetical protein